MVSSIRDSQAARKERRRCCQPAEPLQGLPIGWQLQLLPAVASHFCVLQAAYLGSGPGLTLRTSKEILHSLAHIGFPVTAEQAASIQVLSRPQATGRPR